ncbi:hypothetical protein HZB04_02740 [Candidatus Wolfebacteria bacterium]|nr:hypothetical protein [Candidatus Wolfebacteria bacterium]
MEITTVKEKVGAIGEAFKNAKPLKKNGNGNGNGSLEVGKLLGFEVSVLSEDELRVKGEETQKRKESAQALAQKIAKAKEELRKIEGIVDWDQHPVLVEQHQKLHNFLAETDRAGDKAFQGSLKVAALINEIAAANPIGQVEVEGWLRKVANIGRGRFISRPERPEWIPQGSVVFKKFCLIHIKSEIHPNDVASPADRKIFYELKEFVRRYFKSLGKESEKKIQSLRKKGNKNLQDLKDKKPGFYQIYFPSRKDEKGKFWKEGIGLVELVNINKTKPFWVIKAVDGTGSLHWLDDYRGTWVPIVAIFTGRVIKEKTLPEVFEFSERFARALHAALKNFERNDK